MFIFCVVRNKKEGTKEAPVMSLVQRQLNWLNKTGREMGKTAYVPVVLEFLQHELCSNYLRGPQSSGRP